MLYFSPIKFLVMSDYFFIITILVVLSAVFGYINVRFLKLPNSIGLMLITIVFTFGVFALSYFDSTLLDAERFIIKQIDLIIRYQRNNDNDNDNDIFNALILL